MYDPDNNPRHDPWYVPLELLRIRDWIVAAIGIIAVVGLLVIGSSLAPR